jgi:hypothetical protein
MIGDHDLTNCRKDLVEHIAGIEAGWTLAKPWKALDSDGQGRENVEEIRTMLARWEQHGIQVVEAAVPPTSDGVCGECWSRSQTTCEHRHDPTFALRNPTPAG